MIDDAELVDPHRTRCLCDVGAPDYLAATTVSADGTVHLLLARADAIGDESVTYSPTCSSVAHEQLGPLPPRWHSRAALAPLRCGRTLNTETRTENERS
jgi:hypothetical protein